MPALGSCLSNNMNLTLRLSRNQARFENQSTFANFSKLPPCNFCNKLFPHDPRAALLFASVYAIRLRDFDEQALDSLREKLNHFARHGLKTPCNGLILVFQNYRAVTLCRNSQRFSACPSSLQIHASGKGLQTYAQIVGLANPCKRENHCANQRVLRSTCKEQRARRRKGLNQAPPFKP